MEKNLIEKRHSTGVLSSNAKNGVRTASNDQDEMFFLELPNGVV